MKVQINPIYTPLTEKQYCCVPAVLHMILKRRKLKNLSQEEIGWELGLTVPKEITHLFNKVRSQRKVPIHGWGTKTYKKKFSVNNLFIKKHLSLICTNKSLQNKKHVSQFISNHLQDNHDIVVCYNSQVLFNGGDREHVSLIQAIDGHSITLIDPAIGVPKIRKVTLPKLLQALLPQKEFWIISSIVFIKVTHH